MNAVAKREEEPRAIQAAEAPSEAAAIIGMIERAAMNPDVDMDKFERLFAMRETIVQREAKMAFTAALAEMQPKLPVIDERGEIKNNSQEVQSRYAYWEDINDAIRPILAEFGFALNFRVARSEGLIRVTGVLSHRGGHSEETELELPTDSSGSKNMVQAVGSSVSYGKRYTAIALLNITSRAPQDRDDDGQDAGLSPAVAAAKAAIELCQTGAELALWKRENADGIQKLSPRDADAVIRLYNARVKKVKAEAAASSGGQ